MSRIVKAATAVIIVMTTAVALYGFFLALVGMPATSVQEYNPLGTDGEKTTIQQLSPHALLATLAAAMIIIGLLIRKLKIAWIGLAILFAYSAIFLFSTGGGLLPIAVILLILLAIIHSSQIQKPSPPFWRDPEFYGLLGFILVASTSLLYFSTGMPVTFFLYFIIGAAVAMWGCYRNVLLAWLGGIFVLVLSILLIFSVGLLNFIGSIFLLAGAALKTFIIRTGFK